MDYNIKIKIGNVELFESEDTNVKTPFITNVQLKSSTSLSSMEIGSTASDALYFTLMNPYKVSFDGERVELFISPRSDTSEVELGNIQRDVGSASTLEVIDYNNVDALSNDTEVGEPATAQDIADAIAQEEANIESLHSFFNGEAVQTVQVTTQEEEEPEWIKLGSFFVFKQVNSASDNSIRLECLDGFSRLNDKFEPTVRATNVQTLYNDFRTQVYNKYGITVDEYEFDSVHNIAVNWKFDCTFRKAIGYFAGLVGGFAVFGADDTLGISFYTYNDTILLDDSIIKYSETSAGEMLIEGVICDRSINPYKDDIIEYGAGQTIGFQNPFVNADILRGIYNFYAGIRYVGAEVNIIWNENIQSGEFVRIMSRGEYANYIELNNALATETNPQTIIDIKDRLNSLGKVILVSNQTIDFTGEATSHITSVLESEYNKFARLNSPNDAVFKSLYSEMIAADYIDANRVVTEGLQTGTAEIKRGIIDNLEVGSINGNVIQDGSIVAAALSNEAVKTLSGVKVYYQPNDPTSQSGGSHTINEGDTWYQTVITTGQVGTITGLWVWENGGWAEKQYDGGEIIRAGTITANEISANYQYAGTVQASQVVVGGDRLDNSLNRLISTDTTKAYSKAVPSGANYSHIKKILGESVALNQIIPTTGASRTHNGLTYTNNGNGSWTITGTTTAGNSFANLNYESGKFKWISGHKHFVVGGGSDVRIQFATTPNSNLHTVSIPYALATPTCPTTETANWIRFQCDASGVTVNKTITPQVFDLTQMFGSGNEPTLEECKKLFNDGYFPYNQGELVDATPTNVVSVEKNLFDQKTQYSGSGFTWNGDVLSASMYNLYTKHIMATADMVGKTYMVSADVYVPTGSVTGVNLAVTQSGTATYSPTVTANGTWKRATVKWTPTSTSDYFYITYNGSGGTSVTAQMRNIQWELGSTSTTYAPYKSTSLSVNYGTLRSCGNVHDELDLVNGKIIRRVGQVDLGTVNWIIAQMGYFSAYITVVKNVTSGTAIPNLLCEKYVVGTPNALYGGTVDKEISTATTSTAIWVRDATYTDATAFKTAMQGVMLNYELAEPYEESINVIGNVLPTESGGTITFESLGNDYGLHVPLGSDVDHWYIAGNVVQTSNGMNLRVINDRVTIGADYIDIGDPAFKHVMIDNDSVNILDGSSSKASFGERVILGTNYDRGLEISDKALIWLINGNEAMRIQDDENGEMRLSLAGNVWVNYNPAEGYEGTKIGANGGLDLSPITRAQINTITG